MDEEQVTINWWCPFCDAEIEVVVGLQAPVLGDGPIDYSEVVGEHADHCPECDTRLPADFFAAAEEAVLDEKRNVPPSIKYRRLR